MQTVNRLKSNKILKILGAILAILIVCTVSVAWRSAEPVDTIRKRPALLPTFTYISQPDGTAGQDNFLNKMSHTTNNGTSVWIGVGENTAGTDRQNTGVIKFDLSPVPTYAILTNATITLTLSYLNTTNDLNVGVAYLKRDWSESTSTWDIFSTSNNWGAPGALDTTDKNLSSVSAFTVAHTMSVGNTITFTLDGITEMVDGTTPNYGWVLYNKDGANDNMAAFYSSDDTTPSNRPKLLIEYTLPESCQ